MTSESDTEIETEEVIENDASESETPAASVGIDEEVVKSIPITLNVNDAVIAKGEVVAISQNKLGVRILEIVSPMERARKLK